MTIKRLTARHLQILIALQEGPMDRLEILAKRVNLSRTAVSTHLKWLSGEDSSSTKRLFRVVPDLDEDALDLQTVDVFFQTPSLESMTHVEKLCDTHPYTKYRARCYGGGSEVFAQFRIPKNTTHLLQKFLRLSKKNGAFTSYRVLPTQNVPSIFTVPRLEYWNNKLFTWDFNWDEWLIAPSTKKSEEIPKLPSSKLELLTKNDILILSLLTRGSRRKQRVFIEELETQGVSISSQEFSRRLGVLKNNIILRYHVYIDIDAFDLYSNVIITADCKPNFASKLKKRLQSNPLPFRSTLKISDDFMFWYLRLPPSHLSQLLSYLHERVDNLRLSMVDYEKTEVYGLWSEAYDEEAKAWIKKPRFLLGQDS